MNIIQIKQKLLSSSLFKDSFWAVFGNGMGNALMLLSGILIARLLGKDLYGDYGVVKTTMIHIAAFATFGLGITSTKYIALCVATKPYHIKSIIRDSTLISLCFSSIISICLCIFAKQLAIFVEAPSLVLAFRALAAVIIFKAITTTQIGILSGFKKFKIIARNSFWSGIFLLVSCVPLTYFWGLTGSLLALLLSQAFNALVNYFSQRKITSQLKNQKNENYKGELIRFSFPVALQESTYTICHWVSLLLLTKYSSSGELGLYTATAQWNVIIMMIPSLLHNVILSYLSSSVTNKKNHGKTVKLMFKINLITTFIPFIIVYIFAEFIASFYGKTFSDMPTVLRIVTISTIFDCCSNVFRSEFIARGKNWLLFALRLLRNITTLIGVYVLLQMFDGREGAFYYACSSVSAAILFFALSVMFYRYLLSHEK